MAGAPYPGSLAGTAGRHIFCLREDEPPLPDDMLEELERWREQSSYGVSFPPN